MEWNITLVGSGGQGVVLGGIILAEAGMLEKKNAVQSQVYGPEARGGASRSDVIISEDEIDYPKVLQADVLLVMSQMAYEKYRLILSNKGILIVDSDFVDIPEQEAASVWKLPITSTTRERLGKKTMVANIVALGCVAAICKIVSQESLTLAVLARAPKGTEALNTEALALGYELAEQAIQKAGLK
jgi:2-oxoglutarate ferredoxin oxidoreductase subunit gamma